MSGAGSQIAQRSGTIRTSSASAPDARRVAAFSSLCGPSAARASRRAPSTAPIASTSGGVIRCSHFPRRRVSSMPLRRKAARTVRAWDAAVRGRSRSAIITTRLDHDPTAELSRNNKACAQLISDQRLRCSTCSSRSAGNVARNAFETSMVSALLGVQEVDAGRRLVVTHRHSVV